MEALLSRDPNERNAALRQLYDHPTVRPKVSYWLSQYDRVRLEADDIIQEAIVLLYDMVLEGRFRAESNLVTFLLGICRNLIRNNGKKVQRITLSGELPDDPSEDDAADHHLRLEESTAAEDQRDRLMREAIGQLKENCHDTLRLYYYERRSMAEIAEARELANEKQAKKAVHRCREQLRQRIEGDPALHHLIN